MQVDGYKPRIVDGTFTTMLGSAGAVSIVGPKWCGKTTTALVHAKSAFMVSDPSGGFANRGVARLDPQLALAGDQPRLIDEWQEVPGLWDAVRFACDRTRAYGQFILTGSASPARTAHSGTGRIISFAMTTMSLWETGESSGEMSLGSMLAGEDLSATSSAGLLDIASFIVRGGWPESVELPPADPTLLPRSYIDQTVTDDIRRTEPTAHDPMLARRIIASLARNESTMARKVTIARDATAAEEDGDDGQDDTRFLTPYLSALEKLYLLADQPAWFPALRSPVRIRVAPKRHLCDPSLAAAALGATKESLLSDMKTLGNLFEALCVHDLRVYAQALGATIFHYHDNSGLEADAIVELPNQDWAAFEIKLGHDQVDKAATSLMRLSAKMERGGQRPPCCLGVICGISPYGYRRPDGVYVIPITTLGV